MLPVVLFLMRIKVQNIIFQRCTVKNCVTCFYSMASGSGEEYVFYCHFMFSLIQGCFLLPFHVLFNPVNLIC